MRRRKATKKQLATSPFGRQPATVPPKKMMSKKYVESDSSSSESETESESESDSDNNKRKKKVSPPKKKVVQRKKKVDSESSEDSSSEDDHENSGKIIRTPIHKSDFHKYGVK